MSNEIKPGTIIEDPVTGIRKKCVAVNTHSNHDAVSYDDKYTEYIWKKLPFSSYEGAGGGNLIEGIFTKNGTYEANPESFVGIVEVEITSASPVDMQADFPYTRSEYNVPSNMDINEWAATVSVTVAGQTMTSFVVESRGESYLLISGGSPAVIVVNNISDFEGIALSSTGLYLANLPAVVDGIPSVIYSFVTKKEGFDGWNKVTVNVAKPALNFVRLSTSDVYYAYSIDGRDLIFFGAGVIPAYGGNYGSNAPWRVDSRYSSIKRIIITSDILGCDDPYAFYNSPSDCTIIILN